MKKSQRWCYANAWFLAVGRSSFRDSGHQGRWRAFILGSAVCRVYKSNQKRRVSVQCRHPRSLTRPCGPVPTAKEAKLQKSYQWIFRRGHIFLGHITANSNAAERCGEREIFHRVWSPIRGPRSGHSKLRAGHWHYSTDGILCANGSTYPHFQAPRSVGSMLSRYVLVLAVVDRVSTTVVFISIPICAHIYWYK